MMIGVVIEEMLPHMLKTPPDRPVISLGAQSDMTAQPSAPMPLPKKASAMKPTITHCTSV